MPKVLGSTLLAFVLSVSLVAGAATSASERLDAARAYFTQDYTEAARLFRLGSDQGESYAQYWLGTLYATGRGVPLDYKEAIKLFRLAAAQGSAQAQAMLGTMYASGQGVLQDFNEAIKWFRLAAAQANSEGEAELGVMFDKGLGVPQNRVAAYALYNLSAAENPAPYNKAIANRTALMGRMKPRELEAAQSLSRKMNVPGELLSALDRFLNNRTQN